MSLARPIVRRVAAPFARGLTEPPLGGLDAAIAALFPDVWYDPSDLATLFQDSSGTTPVTALEQPVGLMLDKSRGLVLGSELVTNGDFSSATGWTLSSGATISGGLLAFNSVASTAGATQPDYVSLPANSFAKVVVVVTGLTAGQFRVKLKGGSYVLVPASVGTHTLYVPVGSSTTYGLELHAAGTTSGTIDNISVRELPGYHAYHTPGDTTTRPTVSRRINLLTKTEDFADAAWTVKKNPVYGVTDANGGANAVRVTSDASSQIVLRQPNYTIVSGVSYTHRLAIRRVTGTGTIHVTSTSNAPTNVTSQVSSAWAYVTVTDVNPQASGANGYFLITLGTSGDSIEVCFPSAVPADLSSLPYQRVNTTTDYDSDASKFPTFLRTDGVNDSLQTNAIDFTGTDKMFVGAAVRKLSDAAYQIVAELSASASTNNGAFVLLSTSGAGTAASNALSFGLRGTASAGYDATAFPVSSNYVASTQLNIAGAAVADEVNPRVNGVVPTLTSTGAANAGTGNFGNHKLYLFMRAGTSLPANIWFFGSLIKGSTLSASQIALAERWLASKTKTVVLA